MGDVGVKGFDVSHLMAQHSNPDPKDPYSFDGVSYAPPCLYRTFRTSADVIERIDEAKTIRRMDDEDILEKSGVKRSALERLTNTGEGCLDDFLAVTEALGICAVCVPLHIVFG